TLGPSRWRLYRFAREEDFLWKENVDWGPKQPKRLEQRWRIFSFMHQSFPRVLVSNRYKKYTVTTCDVLVKCDAKIVPRPNKGSPKLAGAWAALSMSRPTLMDE